jgi:EmrB/QacA subfamily drug resistance transporter
MPSRATATNPWIILAIIAFAQFMVVLDATIVNVALPSIQRDLGFTVEGLQWIVTGYTLTFGGFLLLGGRLADIFGRRLIFLAGLALFALASLACGFATSETQLIVARAVQGLGGALLSPAALSILLDTFREGKARNKALGVWGGVASGGAAVGLLLGGIITEYIGWEWIFYVNVPIGILTILAGLRWIRESRSDEKVESDVFGAVSVTAGLLMLVYGLVKAPDQGWLSNHTFAFLGGAVLLLFAFVINEQRQKHPLIPLKFFRVGNVLGANLASMPITISMFATFFYVTLYIQQQLGFGPAKAGLAAFPTAIVIGISAGVGSQLVNKIGYRKILIFSPLFIIASLLWLAQIPAEGGSYLRHILPGFIIMGLGMGASFVAMTIAATSGVPKGESGLASGLINTSQQIGGALGLAILTAVGSSRTKSVLEESAQASGGQISPQAVSHALVEGYHWAFYAGAGIAVLSIIFAIFVIKNIKPSKDAGLPLG